jgi:hypothetical protein
MAYTHRCVQLTLIRFTPSFYFVNVVGAPALSASSEVFLNPIYDL